MRLFAIIFEPFFSTRIQIASARLYHDAARATWKSIVMGILLLGART